MQYVSHKHSQIAWELPVESTSERIVLLAISKYANSDTNECFPSISTIASMCLVSKRSVYAAIKSFTSKGWIQKTTGGGSKSNTYKITFPTGESNAPVNGIHRTGEPIAQTGELYSPELGNEVRNQVGRPPKFDREIRAQIEDLKAERDKNRLAFSLDHSLEGRIWRTQEAKTKDATLWKKIVSLKRELGIIV